jgi:hypothetical protein
MMLAWNDTPDMHPMLCSTAQDFLRYDTAKLLELQAALPVNAPIRAIVMQALQIRGSALPSVPGK